MLFTSPVGKTAMEYLSEELRLLRQLRTFGGDDPLCVSLPGPHVDALLEQYRELHPRIETPEGTVIPVFFVELTPPPEQGYGVS